MAAELPHKASLYALERVSLYQMNLGQHWLHVLEDPFPV